MTSFVRSVVTTAVLSALAFGVRPTLCSGADGSEATDSSRVARMLERCDDFAEAGDLRNWIDSADAALREAQKSFPPDHEIVRRAHASLGLAYLTCRHYPHASRELGSVWVDIAVDPLHDFPKAAAGLTLSNLAAGNYESARAPADRLLREFDKPSMNRQDSLVVIDALAALGTWFMVGEQGDSTLLTLTRGLDMAKAARCDTLTTAFLCEQLAHALVKRTEFDRADSMVTAMIQMMNARYGANHALLAPGYGLLGMVRQNQRWLDEAKTALQTGVELTSSGGPELDGMRAELLMLLSYTCYSIGDLAYADSIVRIGSDIAVRLYGPDNPHMLGFHSNRGAVAWALGDLSKARDCFEEGVRICRANKLTEESEYAYLVNNLAMACRRLGQLDKAESLFEESLELRQKLRGPDHPDVARAIQNLANLYTHTGKVDRVEPLMLRAIKIWEATFGPDDWEVAPATYNLGVAYFSQGKYEQARQSCQRAIRIWSSYVGESYPSVGKSWATLARVYACMGQLDSSEACYRRLLDLRQDFAKYAFSFSSDASKLSVLAEHPVIDHSLIHLAVASGDRRLAGLAMDMLLRGKAVALDAMRSDRLTSCSGANDELDRQYATYRSVCDSISGVALSKSSSRSASSALTRLVSTQDSLESLIARQCSGFKDDLQWRSVTAATVSGLLPDSTVLWEFIRYKAYDFTGLGTDEARQGKAQYAAFILDRTAVPRLIPLGDADVIDDLIDAACAHMMASAGAVMTPLGSEVERRWFELGGQISAKLLTPLLAHTPEGNSVIVSPDSRLSLIPMEILPLSDSAYLVESRLVSYLASGRDLLGAGRRSVASGEAFILADPLLAVADAAEETGADGRGAQRHLVGTGPCPTGAWPALPQTRQEAEAIAGILGQNSKMAISVFTGDRASEEQIKHLEHPPKVLHIATHGYFCPLSGGDTITLENPLLRSGLILAASEDGENPGKAVGSEDGFLTALEVSALDLTATELVCLSACESGAGDVVDAEGVSGLRRAFQMAGCRTLMVSLWSLDDETAKDIVTRFYRGWSEGQSGRQALRDAELQLLARARSERRCGHPRLWGGFIIDGAPDR